jgi:hypothetical protein
MPPIGAKQTLTLDTGIKIDNKAPKMAESEQRIHTDTKIDANIKGTDLLADINGALDNPKNAGKSFTIYIGGESATVSREQLTSIRDSMLNKNIEFDTSSFQNPKFADIRVEDGNIQIDTSVTEIKAPKALTEAAQFQNIKPEDITNFKATPNGYSFDANGKSYDVTVKSVGYKQGGEDVSAAGSNNFKMEIRLMDGSNMQKGKDGVPFDAGVEIYKTEDDIYKMKDGKPEMGPDNKPIVIGHTNKASVNEPIAQKTLALIEAKSPEIGAQPPLSTNPAQFTNELKVLTQDSSNFKIEGQSKASELTFANGNIFVQTQQVGNTTETRVSIHDKATGNVFEIKVPSDDPKVNEAYKEFQKATNYNAINFSQDKTGTVTH